MLNRDQIVETARRLARQGNYQGAIGEYERLVEADPKDLEARLRIGYLYACNRDREAAAETYLEVAHAYEHGGDPDTAAKVLTQVLRLRPELADVYFWLSDLLAGLGQAAEARRWLEAAERLLLKRKRPTDALRAVEAMVELDPGNVALLIRLGEGLLHADRREEALASLRQAADVLRMAEWVDDFIKVAERITYLDPSDTALAKELAALCLRRREPKAALRKLHRCYQTHQDDPETLGLLVETFLALGEIGKAVTILEALAELHRERGEAGEQEAAWKRILTLDPGWVPRDHRDAEPDTQVGKQPLELVRDVEVQEGTTTPLTTDEHKLLTLERSLQPDPAGGGAGRRFLPALTAQTEERASKMADGTTELEIGDLEEVVSFEMEERTDEVHAAREPGGPREPGGVRKARRTSRGGGQGQSPRPRAADRSGVPPMTQELDLADLEIQEVPAGAGQAKSDEEELRALEEMIDEETDKRPPFRPATTLPDAPATPPRGSSRAGSPRRRPGSL